MSDFCIKGTLDMLRNGKVTISQCEEIVNIWIKVTKEKAYAEGWLDGLRQQQRAEKHSTRHLNDLGIDSY